MMHRLMKCNGLLKCILFYFQMATNNAVNRNLTSVIDDGNHFSKSL